jgi:hypothetical protein
MIAFPNVTKSFTVINTSPGTAASEHIRVHFQSGSNVTAITLAGQAGEQGITDDDDVIARNHFIRIPPQSGSFTFDCKCSKVYISNGSGNANLSYQVWAELTGIPAARMYHLTGSGITGVPGSGD